jgi:anti-anti-sigma factor
MRFEKNVDDKYTEIKLLEEKLDSRISPNLKGEFITLNSQGVQNIILNLENVKYVDSSGLSAILTANRLCSNSSGVMVLCGINSHVEKLIKISHLNDVLNIMPTSEEAREAVFMFVIENEITKGEAS